jgi:aminoglycoside phosphotransferase (APT) family kinase protein
VEAVGGWLEEHVPRDGRLAVVHGDYRLGNVMYAARGPARIVALLDWELATLGDPLADLGYLLATFAEPGDDLADPLFRLGTLTAGPGHPGRHELAARYREAAAGDVGDVRPYEVLGIWKAAIFLEGCTGATWPVDRMTPTSPSWARACLR